jgi:hypothetical protein
VALTRHEQELLELERRWPRHCAGKIQAVSEFFDLTIAEYERQLGSVLELPAATAYDPELVRQCKRHRKGLAWFTSHSALEWH